MASTYTTNLGIEKPGNGDQSGTWGTTVNENSDIMDRAISGVGAIALSGTTHTLTTLDGALSPGQYRVLVLGGSPSGTNTITVSPNDAQKVYYVKNTSGQSAIFTQGSGGNVTVANGDTKIIYCDGAGAGAAVVDITADLAISSISVTGGTINGTVIGGSTAAAGSFTTLSASTSLTLSGTAITATASEINILDGVTATTAEINILDGVTATTAEINYIDGVTSPIQTQLNAKQATDPTLTALAAYNTNGIVTQTAADTFTGRTLTGTADQIAVANGNGVSGNPTVSAVIASQAEAEAGTNTTKLMTAQRVAQAISAQVSGGLGVGQTWQNVLASRTFNTAYQNTTGRPIQVAARGGSAAASFEVSSDGSTWVFVCQIGGSPFHFSQAVIPDGYYYRVNGSISLTSWAELR